MPSEAKLLKFFSPHSLVKKYAEILAEKACQIYRGLWKIEESFRILKTDLRARPVFVWSDKHIQGHFLMCFVSLCLLRYTQYLLETQLQVRASAETIMAAIHEPIVLAQGDYPNIVVTPTKVSQLYLDLAKLLGLPVLRTNMSLTQFRSSTKFDLSTNLK